MNPNAAYEAAISVSPGEVRLALSEAGRLVEIAHHRQTRWPPAGTILLGRVAQVREGVGAFVTIGERPGGSALDGFVPWRERPAGATPLSGERVLVQVIRAASSGKPPRLTAKPTIQGARLALRMGASGIGTSARLDSDTNRRIARLLGERAPADAALLVRRYAADVPDEALMCELDGLIDAWQAAEMQASRLEPGEPVTVGCGPVGAWLGRVLAETTLVRIDDERLARDIAVWLDRLGMTRGIDIRLQRPGTAFEDQDIEAQMAAALDPVVPGPDGASLIIEPTSALVAIDVNGGRSREKDREFGPANRWAVGEIATQVRLRGLGGLIVADMAGAPAGDAAKSLHGALVEAFARDPERVDVLPPSRFGVVEMSRARNGPDLATLIGVGDGPDAEEALMETAALAALRTVLTAVHGDTTSPGFQVTLPDVLADWLSREPSLMGEVEDAARRPIQWQSRGDPPTDLNAIHVVPLRS